MRTQVRVWTGPVLVTELAEKARQAGLTVITAGTEHLYLEVEHTAPGRAAADHNLRAQLYRTHGTDFGLTVKEMGASRPEPCPWTSRDECSTAQERATGEAVPCRAHSERPA